MKNNQRIFKNFFLYQTFQTKLIGVILLINFVSTLIFYFAIKHFFGVFTNKGKELGIPDGHVFFRFIGNLESEMNLIFIASTIISIILITLGAYFISHKVSGPLYRLRKELKEMNQNKKLHPLKFRKNDYILDIEEEFNNLIQTIDIKEK